MSREIKFRAWDIKNKRFVNIVRLILDQFGALDYAEVVFKGKIYKLYPSEIVLEQDTGLKDKNGKEIREGDIIKVVNVHDGDEECWEQPYGPAIPQEVKWNEELLRWSFGGCRRILYAPEDFEVIGNIHEKDKLVEIDQVKGGEE